MPRKDAWCLLLYVTFAVATGFADLRMRAHTAHVVDSFIPGVVANTEFAPGRYRVLAPFMIRYTADLTGASLLNTWYATRLFWIFVAFCVLHGYLRTWVAAEGAFAGVALVAATLPLTFTNSWPHPDHIPELALFTAGAWAIAKRSDRWFAVALLAAALNRETSVFLVMLYFIAQPLSVRHVVRTGLFGLGWSAVYAGLRLVRGLQHYEYWQVGRNIADLKVPLPAEFYDPYYRMYAYFGLILFGPIIYVAVRQTVGAPPFVRRALLVVPAVALVGLLFSNIIESRIFTPIYALVLPAAVCAFFEPDRIDAP